MHKLRRATFLCCILLGLLAALLWGGALADGEPGAVVFSLPAGAYPEERIELTASQPTGCEVRYTLDGSLPTEASPLWEGTLTLSGSGQGWLTEETAGLFVPVGMPVYTADGLRDAHILRAAAFAPDGSRGPVTTGTYFTGMSLAETYGCMVVSIVTEPSSLLDDETGILIPGAIGREWYASEENRDVISQYRWDLAEGNYTQTGREWERAASIELFDGTDTCAAQADCGIRVRGNSSRLFPNRSFNVYFRKSYGTSALEYPLFPDAVNEATGRTVSRYTRFTLRNGGNEAYGLQCKDSWLQEQLAGNAFTVQDSRMAVVYLNGEFWGAYSLNCKYTDGGLRERYGVEDAVVIKEGERESGPEEGLELSWELLRYAYDRDLSDPAVWDAFAEVMDVQSMADYYAAQVYIGNFDFGDWKNIALWRSMGTDSGNPWADGRWRYLMYGVEFSSGLYQVPGETMPDADNLSLALENCPLLASALRSKVFREMFLASLRRIGTEQLSPKRVEATLREWTARWEPCMEAFWLRFGDWSESWESSLQNTLDYYRQRYEAFLPQAEALLAGY